MSNGCSSCGYVVYADTEDWEKPLCYKCFSELPESSGSDISKIKLIKDEVMLAEYGQLRAQIKQAEDALAFYADNKSWVRSHGSGYTCAISSDREILFTSKINGENYAGKRAREYFEKYPRGKDE